ncbi:haloalkane dehalogenase [Deinococcus sp.]|uniref:haloalkane dehalogenase n=1 Tax=Deinococcus sp. TaxID=47478 RepID=UPI003B5BBB10
MPTSILRTPDAAFADLPGYAFAPHYLSDLPGYLGLRLHYLDEGPEDAPIWLCLHGQPSWSYLYRKMIPLLVAAGQRVIAPDLYGFGKSDKPESEGSYSFDFHREALLRFMERLEMRGVTLVCQDWGGLLGLTLPLAAPERFSRLLVMNTALGTGDIPLGEGFLAWRAYANAHPDLDVAGLFKRSCSQLSEVEAAAYVAPFPDASFQAGSRAFPNLVPDQPDAPGAELSRRARVWWQNEWTGQTLMAVGQRDPVLGEGAMASLRSVIRGCPPPLLLPDAGHFVQEDAGEQVARAALSAFGLVPAGS